MNNFQNKVSRLYRLKHGKKIGKWKEEGDTDDISLTSEEEPTIVWTTSPDGNKIMEVHYPQVSITPSSQEEESEEEPQEDLIQRYPALIRVGDKYVPLGSVTGKSYPTYLDDLVVTATDPNKSYIQRIGESVSRDGPLYIPSLEEANKIMIPLMTDAALMGLPFGLPVKGVKWLFSPVGKKIIAKGAKALGKEAFHLLLPGRWGSRVMLGGRYISNKITGKPFKSEFSFPERLTESTINGGYMVGETYKIVDKIANGEPLTGWDYVNMALIPVGAYSGLLGFRMTQGAKRLIPAVGFGVGAGYNVYESKKDKKRERQLEEKLKQLYKDIQQITISEDELLLILNSSKNNE